MGVESSEVYQLQCRECGFTYDIPTTYRDLTVNYSVAKRKVEIICGYGGQFTVTLKVKEFFGISKQRAKGGRVLMASIGDNMKALHSHLMSHYDPLFLIIRQAPRETRHEYKREPEGATYVRFSKDRGIDIIGNINVSKAEIPGVS